MGYWFAAYAPAGTPKPIVDKLNRMFAKATQTEEVKATLARTSGEVALSTPRGWRSSRPPNRRSGAR
jgi:tripartite-type tricarboxylate transporter receptor subunit TctC